MLDQLRECAKSALNKRTVARGPNCFLVTKEGYNSGSVSTYMGGAVTKCTHGWLPDSSPIFQDILTSRYPVSLIIKLQLFNITRCNVNRDKNVFEWTYSLKVQWFKETFNACNYIIIQIRWEGVRIILKWHRILLITTAATTMTTTTTTTTHNCHCFCYYCPL
jgi:hypothetical protein